MSPSPRAVTGGQHNHSGVHAGWLEKRGSGLLRNVWHRRYFELQGRGLRWLISPEGEERGRTPLAGVTAEVSTERRFAFTISSPHLRRGLMVAARSEAERAEWIRACRAAAAAASTFSITVDGSSAATRSSSAQPRPGSPARTPPPPAYAVVAGPVAGAGSTPSAPDPGAAAPRSASASPAASPARAAPGVRCPSRTLRRADTAPPSAALGAARAPSLRVSEEAPRTPTSSGPSASPPPSPSPHCAAAPAAAAAEGGGALFRPGEWVEVRDDGRDWREGVVAEVDPLRVRPVGWDAAYEWHEVRRVGDGDVDRWRHPNLLKQEVRRLRQALAEAQSGQRLAEERAAAAERIAGDEGAAGERGAELRRQAEAAEQRTRAALAKALASEQHAARAEEELSGAVRRNAELERKVRALEEAAAQARDEARRAQEALANRATQEAGARFRDEERRRLAALADERAGVEDTRKRLAALAAEAAVRREAARREAEGLCEQREQLRKRDVEGAQRVAAAEELAREAAAARRSEEQLRAEAERGHAALQQAVVQLRAERSASELERKAEQERAAAALQRAEEQLSELRAEGEQQRAQLSEQGEALAALRGSAPGADCGTLAAQVWTLERALELRNEEIARLRGDVEALAARHERIQHEQREGARELQRMQAEAERLAAAQAEVARFGQERRRWEEEKKRLQQELAKGGRMAEEDRWLRQLVGDLTKERDALLTQLRGAHAQQQQASHQAQHNQQRPPQPQPQQPQPCGEPHPGDARRAPPSNNSAPPQMQPQPYPQRRTLYDELGLPRSATPAQLKGAYHKAALRWHPDKWADATQKERAAAEGRFKEVSRAYAILIDPIKRREYDRRN